MLVAIAIPIFTTQLEKSREATDLANLRAAYAEMMTKYLEWDGTSTISNMTVPAKQSKAGWQMDGNDDADAIHKIGDAGDVGAAVEVKAKTSGNYTLAINTSTGAITVS